MILIIVIIAVIYMLLIAWTWHSLGEIEKSKKVMVIGIGILIIYFMTLFIFLISKQGIVYENVEMSKAVRNVLVIMFTSVNGLIVLPFLARQLDKIHEGEMEKTKFSKITLILLIIFIICLGIEYGYMKSTQQGILNIYIQNKGK